MDKLKLKINNNNPWYVGSHFDMARMKPYAKVIEGRLKFISECIENRCSPDTRPIKALDAGCGDGVYLRNLSRINKIKFFGMDYNDLRVLRAKNNVDCKIALLNGNLHNIPIKDNVFDIILLSQVLEHVDDDRVVLREMFRTLNFNGMLILGIPNEGCLFAKIRNNITQRSILKETDHVNFYTERKIITKLRLCGFRIVSVKRESFFLFHTRLNDLIAGSKYGLKFLNFLAGIIKSQCAGLYIVCKK